LAVDPLLRKPKIVIEVFEKNLMDFEVALVVVCEQATKVFEGAPTAVDMMILPCHQKISEVEIFLHVEGYVDGGDGEEKTSLVLLHHLHLGSIPLDEPQYQLQRQHSSSPEVGLGALSLKAEAHPFLARSLGRLLKVLCVQTVHEIPSLLLIEQYVSLCLELMETLCFFLRQRTVLTAHTLLARLAVFGVGQRFAGQQVGLSKHIIIPPLGWT
jgi:hypothetical protein